LDTFEEFGKRVVKAFNEAGLDYVFTGALAASYYGRPRTTLDIDLVVKMPPRLSTLTAALSSAGVEASEEALLRAWRSQYRIATLPDTRSPHTLDLILTESELAKRPGLFLGLPCFYEAPEFFILAKLRMMKATIQPERAAVDRQDVAAILEHAELDLQLLVTRAKGESTYSLLEPLLKKRQRLS